MPEHYLDIPVDVARQIAERFLRRIVVILAWDGDTGLLHTTTYGMSANDKLAAASAGELATKALGFDLGARTTFEDFRMPSEAAEIKRQRDELGRLCEEVLAVYDDCQASGQSRRLPGDLIDRLRAAAKLAREVCRPPDDHTESEE